MHVLVTGGSSGIGAATARAFGRAGHRVTLTYNTGPDRAERVVKEIEQAGGQARAVHLDLADHDGIRAVVAEAGPFDSLIANAVLWGGTGPSQEAFEDVPAEHWTEMLHANVVGNVVLVQSVLPGMREKGFGRIVLVSSGIAEEGTPGSGPYGSAKAALHGLARTLAWQAGGDGVLVNVLAAGLTITERDFLPQAVLDGIAAKTPSRRLSTAEDAAALLLFLGSEQNRNLTGEIVRDGSNAGRSVHV
ncbi:SDR family NAD(P)-dependent oxidoreductase [Nonomuraea sediminis]|uniref:SDR family NAD(P)-dependent oxidoreductase n=1 Tax=Nonomuraea sediminis TaxID=2835864 RepID=UPI001BDD73F0|nr:SDR family oxidoreductase [Nonomuraea sediminis]